MKKHMRLLVLVIVAGVIALAYLLAAEEKELPETLAQMFEGVLTRENTQVLDCELPISRDPSDFWCIAVDGVSAERLASSTSMPHYRPSDNEYAALVERYIEAYLHSFDGMKDMLSAAQAEEAVLFVQEEQHGNFKVVLFDEGERILYYTWITY